MRTCTEVHPMPREEPLRLPPLPLKADSVHLLGMARNVLPGVWDVLHPHPNPQRRCRLRHRVTRPSVCLQPCDSREKHTSFFLCDHCSHQFYLADEEKAGLRDGNSQRMLKTEFRDSGAGAGILPCCWRNKLTKCSLRWAAWPSRLYSFSQ